MKGSTEPRIFTKPLRKLTPETSRGFEVIRFANEVLRVKLYPWQEWLLIHLMELLPDGTLRFRKAVVIVARQNGKTLLGAVLLAYWLYVDSARWPEEAPEHQFMIVNGAQKLDIAMGPWRQVRAWGGPDDPKIGIQPDRVPMLQDMTFPPRMVNGEVSLMTHMGAQLLPRTFDGARGKPTNRLFLDELREQRDFEGWSAIEKSMSSQYDGQLVTVSNAGTSRAVLLASVRDTATALRDEPDTEWFIAEWSADPAAGLDDPEAFAAANPSAGYRPGFTVAGLMRSAAQAPDETVERIEVLCQWIDAKTEPLVPMHPWSECADESSTIRDDSELALGVDVDFDRTYSAVSVAGYRADNLGHVETIAHRAGVLWIIPYLEKVRAAQGINRVAVRSRGAAASELVDPLRAAGFDVAEVVGPADGQAAGQFKDAVLHGRVRHRDQGPLNDALGACEGSIVGGQYVFERKDAPLSTAPGISAAYAYWALTRISLDIEPSAYEPSTTQLDEPNATPWWRRH